jgi:DNA ligase-1
MSLITKPMLSATLEATDLGALKYPAWVTPKLDGIRCLRKGGKTLSRKFLPIPNSYIQEVLAGLPDGLDGELMTKNTDGSYQEFNKIQSAVMSGDGAPSFDFCVFDYVSLSLTETYKERMVKLQALRLPDTCKKVLPVVVANEAEMLAFETKCLLEGYEGIMLRTGDSPYKCGRSSLKQGWLLKLKRFQDSEAEIIGFEEQLHNDNEASVDELGHTKRSKSKENLIPAGTLGKFLVREIGETPWKGKEFGVGSAKGMDMHMRKDIWDNRDKYLGKIITYKYQEVGMLTLPRLPIWKGFRSRDDV